MVRANWTGSPQTEPSIYVSTSSDNNTAQTYISWNGDSQVTQWRIYASQDNSTSDGMTIDKMGFETVYEYQLDWPEGVEMMYIWAEGLNGDEVVGTSGRVMVARDGQGGGVSDQSGVGPSNTNSTSGGNEGSEGSSASNDQGNGVAVVRSAATSIVLLSAGLVSMLV